MEIKKVIGWIDARLCFGRYTQQESKPFVKDECFEAGQIAIKALEHADKYRWHDLRKDQKDLPTHNKQYLCAFKNDTVCKYIVLTRSTMLDVIELIERWKEIDDEQ